MRKQIGHAAQAGEVAVAPSLGVEWELTQRSEHGAHRGGEGVADGELDQRDRSGVGHTPPQMADEVERLELRLAEACVRHLLGPLGDGRQRAGVLPLGVHAVVGEEVVVTWDPVQRCGERVDLEDRGEQLGGEIICGHRRGGYRGHPAPSPDVQTDTCARDAGVSPADAGLSS